MAEAIKRRRNSDLLVEKQTDHRMFTEYADNLERQHQKRHSERKEIVDKALTKSPKYLRLF